MGNKLDIYLPKQYSAGQEIKVTINYATTQQCTALGWLEKQSVLHFVSSRLAINDSTLALLQANL